MTNNASIKFSLIGDNSIKKQKINSFALSKKKIINDKNAPAPTFAPFSQQKSGMNQVEQFGKDIEDD